MSTAPSPRHSSRPSSPPARLAAADLSHLFAVLRARGLRIVGPTVRDGAIVLSDLQDAADLPRGIGDVQGPGHYRLQPLPPSQSGTYFGYNAGPQTYKQFLFPPRDPRLQIRRGPRGALQVDPQPVATPAIALVGLRACDLAAITVQDRVFLGGASADPAHTPDARYALRRAQALLIAVECTRAAPTCFCTSMDCGPAVAEGSPYDLLLTEVIDPPDALDAAARADHYFVCRAGSPVGQQILDQLPHAPATADENARAQQGVARAAQQVRAIPQGGIRDALYAAIDAEHPRWDDVAARCLSCGNCTLVCPTCFCAAVDDHAALDGSVSVRTRRWDSCFGTDHSTVHGHPVRASTRARYRQWLSHKLATWIDQFGTSGCVGCGRCITACPAAIDITQECAALRSPREVPAHEIARNP